MVRRVIRLLLIPALVIGVGLLIARAQETRLRVAGDRVRLELLQVLEAQAIEPGRPITQFAPAEIAIVEELRSRLRVAASSDGSSEATVEVRSGDSGLGSDGSATHWALIGYSGGSTIGVRVRVDGADHPIAIIGVFTPEAPGPAATVGN
ncbi:MAG: hypothetical protein EXS03_06940 [Phycisphaerales bacterium]|nr:hypothetical protein [Phycisphaerales bacterium]